MRIKFDAGRRHFGVSIGAGIGQMPFRSLVTVRKDTELRDNSWRPADVNWSAIGSVGADMAKQFAEIMQEACAWARFFDNSDVTMWRVVIEDKGPKGGEDSARSYFLSAPGRSFVDSMVKTLEDNDLMVVDVVQVTEFPKE